MNAKIGTGANNETDGVFCRRVDRVWIDNQVNPNRPHNGALFPQDSWTVEIVTAQGVQATINHPATGGGTWGPNVIQLGQLIEQATGIPYVGQNTGIGDDDDNTTPFFGAVVAEICPTDDYVVSAIATTVGGRRDGRVIQLAAGVIEGELEVWTVSKTKSGVEWCNTWTGATQPTQPDCIFKGNPQQYAFAEISCPTKIVGPHCWWDGDPAANVQSGIFAEADCNNNLSFFYFPAGNDPEPWEPASGYFGDCTSGDPVEPPVADEECTLDDLAEDCAADCVEIGSITGENNGLGISGAGTAAHSVKHDTGSQANTDQIINWIAAGYVVRIAFADGATGVVDTTSATVGGGTTFVATADHTQPDPCELFSQANDGTAVTGEAVTYTAFQVGDAEGAKALRVKDKTTHAKLDDVLLCLQDIKALLDCNCTKIDQGNSILLNADGTSTGTRIVFPFEATTAASLSDFVTPFSIKDPSGCLADVDPATMIRVRFWFDCHDLVTPPYTSTGFNAIIGDVAGGGPAVFAGDSATNTYGNVAPGSATAGVGVSSGNNDKADRWIDFDIPLSELLAGTTMTTSAFGTSGAGTSEYLGDMRIEALTDFTQFGCEDC